VLSRIVPRKVLQFQQEDLLGRTVRKTSCAEETMANRRGLDMHWRGKRQHGGDADDMTQALRAIQARLETIEIT